jgi:predicted acylesterase/phospholipase RssA
MKCLVLSGGSEKGVAYIGILKFLEEINILHDIECIYGVSVGSVFAVLLSIGYNSTELEFLITHINLGETLLDGHMDIQNLFDKFGLLEPHKVMKLLHLLFDKKTGIPNITFAQHFAKYKKKIVINGSCISNYECYYFSKDNYPDMPIIQAVRISISLPFLFEPFRLDDLLFIDGGIYDNFPFYKASQEYKIDDILGMLIAMENPGNHEILDIETYLTSCLRSIDIKFNYLPTNLYSAYTVFVYVTGLYGVETNIDEIKKFITCGYDAIKLYYNKYPERFKKRVVRLHSIELKDID